MQKDLGYIYLLKYILVNIYFYCRINLYLMSLKCKIVSHLRTYLTPFEKRHLFDELQSASISEPDGKNNKCLKCKVKGFT